MKAEQINVTQMCFKGSFQKIKPKWYMLMCTLYHNYKQIFYIIDCFESVYLNPWHLKPTFLELFGGQNNIIFQLFSSILRYTLLVGCDI